MVRVLSGFFKLTVIILLQIKLVSSYTDFNARPVSPQFIKLLSWLGANDYIYIPFTSSLF